MKKLGLVLFVAAIIAGCSSSGGNAAGATVPGSTTGYAGTWAGSMSESSGSMMGSGIMGGVMSGMMSRKMTWQMTESGAGLTGEMEMADFRGTGKMTISGTVSGQTMNFTMNIPAGGMPESGCAAHGNGTAQMNGNTMTGTYAGSNTCSGAFTSGQVTLTRQP
jgi:hypothetical protein